MQYLSNSRRELSNSRSHNYMVFYDDRNARIVEAQFDAKTISQCNCQLQFFLAYLEILALVVHFNRVLTTPLVG